MEFLTFKNSYLSNYVKCFLFRDNDWDVFVDTGLYRQNIKLLAPYLTDGRQKAVLATHGHWDHIGLHAELRRCGARIYGGEGDRRHYCDHQWHWNLLFGQFESDFNLPQARWDTFWNDIGGETDLDIPVADGDVLTFGSFSFEVIALPGHSNGSVCFLEENSGSLFTGDGMMGNGFFAGVPQYCDYDAYHRSMRRLAGVKARMVFSDHTDPIQGADLRDCAETSIDCADRIESAVRNYVRRIDGPLSVGGAAMAFCSAEGKAVGGGACVTALAHLARLREEDSRVAACTADYVCGC